MAGKRIGKRYDLSDAAIKKLKEPGRYPDGGSLYFQITTTLSRSWEYHFRLRARKRTMGLGPYPEVSLKEARELRDEARKLVRNGIDPIIARNEKRQTEASSLTVMQAAERYIEAMKGGWKSQRYPHQIRARLVKYVAPVIGHLPVSDIELSEIKQVLVPIWTKLRVAEDIRQNLEAVLD
jgi:hypothetical protein